MDSGDGVSHGVPICESYTLHHATLRLAGCDFTEYFLKNLTERRYPFTLSAEEEISRDITKKLFIIGFGLRHRAQIDCGINKDKTYELPDGNINFFCAELFRFVDTLFQPSFIDKEASGSTTLPDEVLRHPQEIVRRCRALTWHDHFPRDG